MPVPEADKPSEAKKARHLKVVTDTEPEDVTKDLEEIEDMTADAILEPTYAEIAAEGMRKEKAETGVAKALGREAQAIREVQEKLAMEAIEELDAEAKAEAAWQETAKPQITKPPAKIASRWDRFKGWLRGK